MTDAARSHLAAIGRPCEYRHRADRSVESTVAVLTDMGNDPQAGNWQADTAVAFLPALTGPRPVNGDVLTVDGEEWVVGVPAGSDRETINRRGLGAVWKLYVSHSRGLK
ncbi:MAG: hypothetical protein EOM25_09445 [Deltaproteobacteria bacterium]|nr:hypothetical protein [Deltaproteobacteria bacterium]